MRSTGFHLFDETHLHQTFVLHEPLQRHAPWAIELLVNVVQVQLGRPLADEQLAGDFFIGPAFRHHAGHGQFAGRQGGRGLKLGFLLFQQQGHGFHGQFTV